MWTEKLRFKKPRTRSPVGDRLFCSRQTRSAASAALIWISVGALLGACKSTDFTYGYVNQLEETITVVERDSNGWSDTRRLTSDYPLKGLPGGSVAERVEFLDARQRQIAVFTLDDYKRSRHAGFPPIIVVSPRGAHLASGDLWRRIAQKWDGPLPKHPVSYGGGDGSSPDKAIIIQARDSLDHILAVYAYMRARFGYRWTYREMERYLTRTEDWSCDMYEFVTYDGKKHVLYFRGYEEIKASKQVRPRIPRPRDR